MSVFKRWYEFFFFVNMELFIEQECKVFDLSILFKRDYGGAFTAQ
jgi:hypothetical protein